MHLFFPSGQKKVEDWVLVLQNNLNFIGQAQILLSDIIMHMASEGFYEINWVNSEGIEQSPIKVCYWGNAWAVQALSKIEQFEAVRFIVLNAKKIYIGDVFDGAPNCAAVSSARVFADHEIYEQERKRRYNILLWWTGGHFQLLAKCLPSNDLDDATPLQIGDKSYRVSVLGSQAPRIIRDLYFHLCKYDISDSDK